MLPRFVKELLLSWHSNDWFKERVLVDYPWLCAGLCKATQCPSVHSRLQCPLKAIVPIQGHNALSRPQRPLNPVSIQGCNAHSRPLCPIQGHNAISRPQRPLKPTVLTQGPSIHSRRRCPLKVIVPTHGHNAHARP